MAAPDVGQLRRLLTIVCRCRSTVAGMSGVIAMWMEALTVRPSVHFGRTLDTDGTSEPLRTFMQGFLDGESVLPETPIASLVVPTPSSPSTAYARIAVVDTRRTRLTCFVIDVAAREANDGKTGWDAWDPRGEPRLLDDVLTADGRWALYNCEVAVWPWHRDEAYAGNYPPEF